MNPREFVRPTLLLILALISPGCSDTGAPTEGEPGENLSGGVLIAHVVPGIAYTIDPPAVGWGLFLPDTIHVEQSSEQISRLDPSEEYEGFIWCVLAAWDGPAMWCGVDFGFGDYDSGVFAFVDYGPCYPWGSDGLELPTDRWPGPEEGISFFLQSPTNDWSGNYVPVYFFTGYAYSDFHGTVPLDVNPATGFAGFTYCDSDTLFLYRAKCLGALGILQDGKECYPGPTSPDAY